MFEHKCSINILFLMQVMTPSWLVKQFSPNHGRIMGSTATFGAPFYNERVLGQLVYGESAKNHHCTKDDYFIPPPITEKVGQSGYDKVKLINIVMVRRGSCSFTTKVRVAQDYKEAHAVIIIDREDSDLTSESLANIIVADDGYGGGIHIPSVPLQQTITYLYLVISLNKSDAKYALSSTLF